MYVCIYEWVSAWVLEPMEMLDVPRAMGSYEHLLWVLGIEFGSSAAATLQPCLSKILLSDFFLIFCFCFSRPGFFV